MAPVLEDTGLELPTPQHWPLAADAAVQGPEVSAANQHRKELGA